MIGVLVQMDPFNLSVDTSQQMQLTGNSGGNNVVQLCPHGDTVANRNNFEEDMSGDNGSISPVQQQQQPLRQ